MTEGKRLNNTVAAAVAAERERCARIAEEFTALVAEAPAKTRELIDRQHGLTYTLGCSVVAGRIAAQIRSGE